MPAYQKLRDQFEEYRRKRGVKYMSQAALKWFYKYTETNVKTATFNKTMDLGVARDRIIPGKFYLYKYDPKTKDQLPYYDTLPLVLITSVTSDGWYGINFHYMPPDVRLKIMSGFYDTLKNVKISTNVKLKSNWKRAVQVASAVSAHRYLKHSIKRYLANHIASPLIELDPEYWALCLFLPLSRFKKKSKSYIWNDI